jgi:hypothetical protein
MMVRKGMMFGGSVAAIALFAGSALAATVNNAPFPQKGSALFKTTFARGMVKCPAAPGPWTGGVVSVQTLRQVGDLGGGFNPYMPTFLGCVASPDETDPMQYGKAQLVLNKTHGKFILNGIGFPAATVHLVFGLQITKKSVAHVSGPLNTTTFNTVTLPLMTATCPSTTVGVTGKILQKSNLDACVGPTLKTYIDPILGAGGGSEAKAETINIEVQSVTLVDDGTSNAIGTAGIVR